MITGMKTLPYYRPKGKHARIHSESATRERGKKNTASARWFPPKSAAEHVAAQLQSWGGARQLTSTITQMHGPEPIDGVKIFRSGSHACTGCAGNPRKCP